MARRYSAISASKRTDQVLPSHGYKRWGQVRRGRTVQRRCRGPPHRRADRGESGLPRAGTRSYSVVPSTRWTARGPGPWNGGRMFRFTPTRLDKINNLYAEVQLSLFQQALRAHSGWEGLTGFAAKPRSRRLAFSSPVGGVYFGRVHSTDSMGCALMFAGRRFAVGGRRLMRRTGLRSRSPRSRAGGPRRGHPDTFDARPYRAW